MSQDNNYKVIKNHYASEIIYHPHIGFPHIGFPHSGKATLLCFPHQINALADIHVLENDQPNVVDILLDEKLLTKLINLVVIDERLHVLVPHLISVNHRHVMAAIVKLAPLNQAISITGLDDDNVHGRARISKLILLPAPPFEGNVA